MAADVTLADQANTLESRSSVSEGTIPWYVWCGILAATCSSVGVPWDISWHRSIGRDTFWTPAHIAIYTCGLLAALSCNYVIFWTTFARPLQLRRHSVNILGFYAPLGTFLTAWGGTAMLTSAPFDNWWHSAYGLDVKIGSPPHILLILGMNVIAFGVFVQLLGEMNRAEDNDPAKARRVLYLLLYIAGLMLSITMIQLTEYTTRSLLHVVYSYKAVAVVVPVMLAFFSQATKYRWAATWCTAIYSLMVILEILIFPLFPAQPKLGPVYVTVTHLVPARFPLLLIAPAFVLDIFWRHTLRWKRWQVALVSGVIFAAVLVAVEWPFASFLMSKWSENRFFGTTYFEYFAEPSNYERLHLFYGPSTGMYLWKGLVKASVYGAFGAWVGLTFGSWMKKIQR